MIRSINPATGELIREFEPHSDAEVEQKLVKSAEAFREHRHTPFVERSRLMNRVAEILESERHDHARMITQEMGKPLRAAVQEVEKCALGCRFYAENAAGFLADEQIKTPPTRSFVKFQPIGAVLAVMPWNFPYWQLFRFAAPALMAGNVGLLKHASNVPQCALAIEDTFRRAGFPEGVFQTLLIGSDRVNKIIEDNRIAAVTLTGSVAAGASVASTAGKAIKKTVLELGGSDPFIVMPSANLDQAITTAVRARTINNGQSCIAAKRFIIDHKIGDEFERKFVERMAALKVGDPMDESIDIGPLATADVRDGLGQQVNKTIQQGARVLLGGRRLNSRGFFFEPTILSDIPEGSPADLDELFGPVASLFRVNGIDEALRVANKTQFGLGSCIWTNDERERDVFINEIESGAAFVNAMVASDPRLPFGGIKQSGYGRELSREGIREFVNIKTISIS
ncbi:MAG TPA: NAD-dependent succinate-semialdehyde dehydrogenase [Verrucomicrobiae bacterium]|nr:NAD-dependent succinate-semialdehyde dehydrogenase [Verrucomicrobiae bacterium]